jgi:small-conductance mechanosensitive channel
MISRYFFRAPSPLHQIFRALRYGIVATILAMFPVQAVAAPLLKLPTSAAFAKQSSSGVAAFAPLSDEEIDATITTLQARARDLGTHPLPEGVELISDVPTGATPEEYREWQQLTGKFIYLLESRIQNLRFLKDIRQSARDLETQRRDWRGFAEKPPYPLSLVDSLQDKIKARQIELQTHEMQLTISEGELADYSSSLRESRTQKRLAEERMEQSLGKPGETRLRWLLAMATRRNDLNETGVVTLESQRQMLQEGLAWMRQEIAFLDQKLTLASGNFRFTREELDKKLKGLDARSNQLKLDLENAVKAEEYERTEQEKVRESLQRFKDALPVTATVSPRLEALRQAHEVQQVRVVTAGLKVLVFKALSRLTQIERRAWESRYQFVNHVKDTAPPDFGQNQKDLQTLQSWKQYLRSRLDGVENYIRSQEARISSPDLSEKDRGTARVLLAIYQEQKDLLVRVEEQLSGTEQLLQRVMDEISARNGQNGRVAAGIKILRDDVSAYVGKIWNIDLYVAEETVIVDGLKIVKSRSVTIGKVIQALLIFFIGIIVARKVMRPIRHLAARKFNLNEKDAQVFGRISYYLLFVCVLVFSLVTANIPLAVFAYFGGALAIGVGFGAKTLIGNFISGLILLFDRTIRLNDLVEVDGQRGRVTAINIRSSRVRRFDGIEVLIPNSHFLEEKVINLTLSDPYTRFEITLGVAYWTPTRTAEEVILRAVTDQPEVRSDPAPIVVFENFADSSLTFRAFFWLDVDSGINSNIVLSEIRHRVGDYLAQADISIPFPQRNLHLDTTQPLEVTIRDDRREGAAGPQSEP